ncbi:MAG: aminotransferase class IV [Deltaproteobacteria bacterium]|nr:aminotransferase class IV [Deltaproteobacteria bacterium]MBW2696315.1 aminotransferase class IV [Deltaproteobacteria bacterium]
MDRLIWIDGELAPWERATVHVLSHSLQRGSLVFDYMSVHHTPRGPAIFRMDLHVQRMLRSCEILGLPIAMDAAAIGRAIVETVRANPGASAVKASAYYASVEVDVVPMNLQVTVAIAAYDPQQDIIERLPGERPAKRSSIRLWLEKQAHQRREDIVSPQAKVSANYASSMTAKARAQREGFDEILLVDEDDHVAEGPTTNIFLVDRHGGLVTPPEKKILRGVTRQSIIELAKADGIDVREAVVTPEQLFEASEIFMTGTTAGVLPVESVDGRMAGETCPGPVAQVLSRHLGRVQCGEDPAFDHWLTYVAESEELSATDTNTDTNTDTDCDEA